MKSKISFAAILLLITFFGTVQTKAQCPSWATNWNNYSHTVAGCEYISTICWKCPVSIGQIWITVSSVRKTNINCNNGLNLNQIKTAIYNQINTNEWLLGLCLGAIPPCDDKLTYVFKDYNCWYKRTNYDATLTYYICDYSSYCAQDWTICWDQMSGPISEPVPPGNWYQVGIPGCHGIEPGNPIPGESSVCWPATNCP